MAHVTSRGKSRLIAIAIAFALAFGLAMNSALAIYNEASDTAPVGDVDYDGGVKAVKAQDWRTAAQSFERAAQKHQRSADVFNLLAYAYRKLGDLERAFANYGRALELDPQHRGAHEYIGEAYLTAGNPAKAREHLRELERLCRADCEEYHILARAIREFETSKQKP